jgi:hypothetical protein
MQREVTYPNGVVHRFREKIILPAILTSYNKHAKDKVYQLHAHLCLEGRKYHLPIRRLVYHCFVKPFPLDDLSVVIVSVEGNGLDISPENIQMMDRLDAGRRIFTRKRMISPFRQERYRRKGISASRAVSSRQVSQYDKSGKKIKTYSSITKAARALGIRASQISNVVHERDPTTNGYFWKFGNEKTFDVQTFLTGRRRAYAEKRGTRVTQYDKKGNPVGYYISLQDAAKAVGGHWTSIAYVVRGERKTASGYRWKKGHHKRKIKPLS